MDASQHIKNRTQFVIFGHGKEIAVGIVKLNKLVPVVLKDTIQKEEKKRVNLTSQIICLPQKVSKKV